MSGDVSSGRANAGASQWAPSYRVWGWGGPDEAPTEASLRELAPFVEAATGKILKRELV